MAGEWLLGQVKARGGHQSDYADVVFGTVQSVKPLKVQISNQLILTDDFITLGRHVTKHKEKVTYHDWKGEKDTERTETVEIDESLKAGDGVAMIRQDGGQQFYVFEKVADEEV
ncbi:DUF2577 domain-containing protein [Lentilactobacillus parabuchneri]|uniref:DUF2577 domain-containing protein n=1 Tax=Lentilactobacillus parabuchneri TaxID=152331 RepID=UPI0023083580|nr:DUF2577 domain-containing protein [Lentilactobacillus parabuchneri]MDB1102815.1 DUF2577 domain-containing protein [Lentilactobacillus parabuchneri]